MWKMPTDIELVFRRMSLTGRRVLGELAGKHSHLVSPYAFTMTVTIGTRGRQALNLARQFSKNDPFFPRSTANLLYRNNSPTSKLATDRCDSFRSCPQPAK